MRQVTIFGLGMIGASLGLALKQLKSPPRVIGNDNQYDAAQRANRLKAVDRIERDPVAAVEGSDIVVVAVPVGAIPELLQTIAPALPEGCVVTDTGSTKREIVRRAEEILPSTVGFIGGHPMTGPATGGVDGPSASIFTGAVYCLTPTANTPAEAVQTASFMVEDIGSEPYFVDPWEHDGLVAGISHLPYLLSIALMKNVASEPGWREMSILAAGGFDTATRLSAGGANVFGDILTSNSDNMVRCLDRLVDELEAFKIKLQNGDEGLKRDLEEAQEMRTKWDVQRRKRAEAQKNK